MKGKAYTPLTQAFLLFLLTQLGIAASLAEFATCIGPQGQGRVCQLDAGTYPISATLRLGRSNITVKGTILTSPSDTVLQRAKGFQGQLLQDTVSATGTPTLTSITIRDLTFDGNRAQNVAAYTSYQPEVNIFSTKSVLITNCDFINAPNTSLALYGAGTAGVVVNNSYFGNPVIYGLYGDATGNTASLTYLGCSSLVLPDNIIVANSKLENAGEPAILINATNMQLLNNVFTNNHSYPVPFNDDGGQIDLTVCTANAAIVGNTFQNASASSTNHVVQGIELHGSSVAIVNNTVQNNDGVGISIDGAADVFVANWGQTTATAGNGEGGIAINYNPAGAPGSTRPVDLITIDSAVVINNQRAGIYSASTAASITNLSVTNSCLSGNALGPTQLGGLGAGALIQNNQVAGCGKK